ncbi:porin [Moraxella oblonga]|uniref:porin n=1 Tax=Moraxella oblonga TaxID=200413 RepID=UPI0008337C6C|nr:porin [Moraxella oblonga]
MKKLSLGTAIKSACVVVTTAVCSQAFAQPEIYGQVRLSALKEDSKTTENGVTEKERGRTDLSSGNSRIGVKGSEPLTENTDLEYRLEYKVDVAEKTDGNFSARHGYLALKNKQYGKLLVGRTISYDDNLDIAPSWWRAEGTGYAMGYGGSDWVDNTIVYTTPKFNNGKTDLTLQYGMDEGSKGRKFHTFKNGVKTTVERDFFIVGASHETDSGTLGLAYTRAGKDFSALVGSMSVDITEKTTVGAVAHYADYNSSDNEVGGYLSLAHQVTEPLGVWVEGAYADNYEGIANKEQTKFSVGTTYDFGKSTTTFAGLSFHNTETTTSKTKGHGVEVGAIYRF